MKGAMSQRLNFQEEWIPYKYISPTSGDQHEVRVKVAIQGDPKSYACFLTLHDIGMNRKSLIVVLKYV